MKRRELICLAAFFCHVLACARAEPMGAPATFGATAPAIITCFTPGQDCESAIVAFIDGARHTLHVQAYSFTSVPIADAIVRAHRRGVEVGVLLDPSDVGGRGSQLSALIAAGVPTWIDRQHAIAHSKVVIVDGLSAQGAAVEFGSFNYSAAAQHANAEDLAIVHSRAVAAAFEQNWQVHRAHSEAP